MRCPENRQRLNLQGEWLVREDGKKRYAIKKGIPRFVGNSNYAANFGIQWNRFALTQLDSHSSYPISAARFWRATGWDSSKMRGKWVLDAGCGAGRFTEIALSTGAHVVALDYSSAVDACWGNLRHHPQLHVLQADIYSLPFGHETFDFIYSLGVLQHTPDVGRAFAALPPLLKKGGQLCADFYWKRWQTMLHPKYLLRPATKRIDPEELFLLLETLVPFFMAVNRFFRKLGPLGKILQRMVPVADYTSVYPLSVQQHLEWALLDTFDMLAPAFDKPQTVRTVRKWFEDAKMNNIEIGHWGHLTGRASKP